MSELVKSLPEKKRNTHFVQKVKKNIIGFLRSPGDTSLKETRRT